MDKDGVHQASGLLARLRRQGEGLMFLRFLMVGGANTLFGYALYAGFVLLGAPLWLAVGGSTMMGVLFNFFSYGGLVFGRTSGVLLPRFLAVYAMIGVSNYLLLKLLGEVGLGPLPGQALLVPVLAASGFFAMRRFVFIAKDPHP